MSIPNKLFEEIGKSGYFHDSEIYLSRNYLDYHKIPQEIIKIFNNLPHGSGIDGSWYLGFYKSNFVFWSSYHCMDEYGGYDGWVDFRVIIRWPDWKNFKLEFENGSHAKANRYWLRDYLEETIYLSISEILEEKGENNVSNDDS